MTPEQARGTGTKVGEIIAVETTAFTAQSYELNQAPALGALLRVHAPDQSVYYALCSGSRTGSIEPGRHAVAWGRFEDDEEDIYRRQPQLNQVLRTTFDALLVGYERGGVIAQRVPPTTPRLHALVYTADDAEVARFNADLAYLRLVVRSAVPNADDFIAAAIDHAYRARGRDRDFLVGAGRSVARLLGAEHERVMNILELLNDEA
jgi:hypothetical protein